MWTQFVVSLINMQLFYAFMSLYSSSKDSIKQDFGLSDTFLGTSFLS